MNARRARASSATPDISLDAARAIGCDDAAEWLNRSPDDTTPPASSAAWRARCYADEVHTSKDRTDFLQILAAWELGFDSTMEAGRRRQSAQSRRDSINHIRWQARAVDNLLSAVFLLPDADQQSTMEVSARLADELAGDLAELVRGAA